jgi:hypothetical protein
LTCSWPRQGVANHIRDLAVTQLFDQPKNDSM